MNRGKRLLLVSHCVLNQNSVVHPLARSAGGLADLVASVLKAGVGLVQLPCPEAAFGGLARPPMTRDEYDTGEYRSLCARFAWGVGETLRPMLDDGCRVIGLLGIEGSPSCAVAHPQGIWMEALLELPELEGVPLIAVPEVYPDQGTGSFADDFRRLLGARLDRRKPSDSRP